MEGQAADGAGGSREGRRRPYWRNKAKGSDGLANAEGGEAGPSSAAVPTSGRGGGARRSQQNQSEALETSQGREGGAEGPMDRGSRVPRREAAEHAAAGGMPGQHSSRGPRSRLDGWDEGVGPPPAPPPGLSQVGAARAFKQALPHPYRLGQAQAEAAHAAAESPSHRNGAAGGKGQSAEAQQRASAPKGVQDGRNGKGNKGAKQRQQQNGEATTSSQGSAQGAERGSNNAARHQAGGGPTHGGRGDGRAGRNNSDGTPGGRGGSGGRGANGRRPEQQRQQQQQGLRQGQQGAAAPFQQFQSFQQQSVQTPPQQRGGGGGGRRPIFAEHLPREELQRGLKSGLLFRALFRCNAADRTQGFCTVAGLPSDVFIKGYKSQNRSVEGDEVVIRILPPEQWYQLMSAKQAEEQAKQAQQQQAQQQAQQEAAPEVSSNVVPAAGLVARAEAAGAMEPVGAGAAGEELASPPGWTKGAPAVGMGDLVASPTLCTSGSGGELAFALGPAPVDTESEEEGSEAEEGLSDEEAERVLEEIEDRMQGMSLAGLEPAGTACPAGEAPPSTGAGAAAAEEEGESGAGGQAAAAAAPQQTQQAEQGQQVADEVAEEGGQSMLEFVLSQGQQSAAGPAGSRMPAATPPSPAPGKPASGEIGCWYAAESPEASLQRVVEVLQSMAGWRATGEVVAVVQPSRRRESVIGVLKQEGEGDSGVLLLYPCDPRLPRMLVRPSQLPHALKMKLKQEAACPELSSRTLVSAQIVGWETNHMFPLAQVRESLGQAGELASETRALLAMEQVVDDDKFSAPVLACLPPTPWSISKEEMAKRRDFRSIRLFSIDPPTAKDLDDALSVEDMGGGLYRVGVHIADVSHFVQPGTALDKEAQQRSTSVYLVDRVIPMLPRLLCEELCSLNPGVDRLAFSIVWDMNEEGDIQSTWVGRSVIRSCGKLAYPMVQSMIEGAYLARPGEEPPCELHGPYTWPEVVGDCLALHRIALNLRRRRFDSGALRLDNVRLYFKLDEEGNPHDFGVYEQKEANQLVEEFMLLANMTAAKMVADAFPDRALLRCHPPPNQHKLGELSSVAKDLGFLLDVSSAGALQESLAELRAATEGDYVIDIITLLATKPMQVARYFCTGETPDESYWRHYALAVSHYTHFTSPIRRYPDIIVHRLLAAAIDAMGGPQARADRHRLLPARETGMVAAHANDRKLAAKSVQDGSLRLYLCVMLHRQPIVCDGVVMAVGGSRFFDVYVPALGVDVRVHTNSVLKGAEAAVSTYWDPQNKVLTLRRARDATPEGRTPEDLPDYSTDIPNFEKAQNPRGVCKAALPLTVKMLAHVSLVVSSKRSQTSGSPTHVVAKLWVE